MVKGFFFFSFFKQAEWVQLKICAWIKSDKKGQYTNFTYILETAKSQTPAGTLL